MTTTEREIMINNEQVKLTANFLSRIGIIVAMIGLAAPVLAFSMAAVLWAIGSIIFGILMNVAGWWYLGKLKS